MPFGVLSEKHLGLPLGQSICIDLVSSLQFCVLSEKDAGLPLRYKFYIDCVSSVPFGVLSENLQVSHLGTSSV